MKKTGIKNSIVADGGSTISNSTNTVHTRKIITVSGLIGFVLGIISSIIGSYVYEHFIK